MEYWKDESEPIKAFLRLYDLVKENEELREATIKVNKLIWYDYTQSGPNCSFWVDGRGGELKSGPGKPNEDPDVTLSLSVDDAHKAWSNKLNVVMAITRKKIKIKGSAVALLKTAPKLKKVALLYNQALTELGWEDKIL